MKIENRINELRIRNNLSFEGFAAIGGVSERSQRMYENGKTTPSIEYCTEIAKFFKIDLNWLLTGEGEMLKIVPPRESAVVSFKARMITDLILSLGEDKQQEILAVIRESKRVQQLETDLNQLSARVSALSQPNQRQFAQG